MILEGKSVQKFFPIRKGVFLQVAGNVRALDGVDFTLEEHQTLGIVGESGCGKTTLGKTVARIHPLSGGSLTYHQGDGEAFSVGGRMSRAQRRRYQRDVQMVFQDPFNSLDPRMNVNQLIGEPLDVHGLYPQKQERRDYIASLLERVGLYAEYGDRFPHEFSGGQRQRISIARALALKPRLVICDEPTSALDVSVQSQVINLLEELKRDFGLSYMFISHDLDVVHHISDRIMVMYLGMTMEEGPAEEIIGDPLHPYTQTLIASIPRWTPGKQQLPPEMEGEPPSPIAPPPGCPFQTRCPRADGLCRSQRPALAAKESGKKVACHHV